MFHKIKGTNKISKVSAITLHDSNNSYYNVNRWSNRFF